MSASKYGVSEVVLQQYELDLGKSAFTMSFASNAIKEKVTPLMENFLDEQLGLDSSALQITGTTSCGFHVSLPLNYKGKISLVQHDLARFLRESGVTVEVF